MALCLPSFPEADNILRKPFISEESKKSGTKLSFIYKGFRIYMHDCGYHMVTRYLC